MLAQFDCKLMLDHGFVPKFVEILKGKIVLIDTYIFNNASKNDIVTCIFSKPYPIYYNRFYRLYKVYKKYLIPTNNKILLFKYRKD